MTISIRTKLLALLALNLCFMLALGAFAVRQMRHMNDAATFVHAHAVPARNEADVISGLITRYRSLQLEYMVNISAADHGRIEQALVAVEQDMERALQRYAGLPCVGGSDSHELATIGTGYTRFPGRGAADLYEAIRQGTTVALGSTWGLGPNTRLVSRWLWASTTLALRPVLPRS